ncbi:MAG: hypothetical protein HY815_25705 [Candidatus Riflebacteria bacterium]|nr:hypothetical protein [Candidatus Riflebacteria bacterium]
MDLWRDDYRALSAAVHSDQLRYQEYLRKGHELAISGVPALDTRENLLLAISREFPGSGRCFFDLSVLYQQRGDVESALKFARYSRRFLPGDSNSAVMEAHLLIDSRMYSEAAGVLRGCLALMPDHPSIRAALALALARLWEARRGEQALLDQVLELCPAHMPPHVFGGPARVVVSLLRCFALHHLGRVGEAEALRIRLLRWCDFETYVPELIEYPVESWSLETLFTTVRRALPRAA